MLPSWPSDKPIFLPENMVPEQTKKKAEPEQWTMRVPAAFAFTDEIKHR